MSSVAVGPVQSKSGSLEPVSSLDTAVAECMARERQLLQSATRSSAEALEGLLDAAFREIGASGTLWSRKGIIEALVGDDKAQAGSIADEEMEGRRLTEDLVLLTYVSDAAGRRARRSSLWRRSGESWLLVHHQGTLLS